MIALWIVIGALAILIAVLLVRTVMFKPKESVPVSEESIVFDKDANIDSLAQLIRCKTVSYYDASLEDDREFEKLIDLLPTLYPEVFRVCTLQRLPDRALLFYW